MAATYADLVALREDETIVRRVLIALQAAAHVSLANPSATPPEIYFARGIANEPRAAAERYFFLIITSATILGKLAAPATIVDADFLASASEVFANLAVP